MLQNTFNRFHKRKFNTCMYFLYLFFTCVETQVRQRRKKIYIKFYFEKSQITKQKVTIIKPQPNS